VQALCFYAPEARALKSIDDVSFPLLSQKAAQESFEDDCGEILRKKLGPGPNSARNF
jgi:hypothetical protein